MTTEEIEAAIAAMLAQGASAEALRAAIARLARPVSKRLMTTAAQVQRAGIGKHKVSGATGLYLRKTSDESGGGAWVWRFWFGGKRREMGLGSLTDISLAEARKRVAELRVDRHQGANPIEARQHKRADALAEARKQKPVLFREAFESYLATHSPTWKRASSIRTWEGPVRKYALPILDGMSVDEIQVAHVVAVRKAADAAGVPDTGRRAVQRIKAILDSAIALGQRNAARGNPADAALVGKAHPTKRQKVEHYRRLAIADAPTAFQKLIALACDSSVLAAWCLMIACAVRPSEALLATWDEIDLERALWVIPAARTKTDKEHVAPLSTVALEVLQLQAARRVGAMVFRAARGDRAAPYTAFAAAPARKGFDAGSPHSWRSIFRDWAGDIGRIDRDLAEAALAHTLGNVEGSYRRLTAIEARRGVMARYADWLTSATADNVLAFPLKG
jgi:integrase